MLCTMTSLRPISDISIRWFVKYKMLRRFNCIRSALISVSNNDGVKIVIDRSEDFSYETKRYY